PDELRNLLEHPAGEVRVAALVRLFAAAPADGGRAARAGLASPKPADRAEALRAIGEARPEDLRRAPRELLLDPDLAVRKAAIGAVGRIADPGALEALLPLCEEAAVKPEALDALGRVI